MYCQGFFNVQVHTKYAFLLKELCKLTDFDLVAQGRKKVNISKYGRFRYEMIDETQLGMELLEEVAFIQLLFANSK